MSAPVNWIAATAFDNLVRETRDAIAIEVGHDEAGDYYATVSREGTEWRTRPVADVDLARAGGAV